MAGENPKDPRYRPYRAAMWAIYLVVAVGFSLLVTVSVWMSVREMTPSFPETVAQPLDAAACVVEARKLFDELEARRQGLALEEKPSESDLRWTRFRVEWLNRERGLEARCSPHQPGREKLEVMFARLNRVLDLYTTSAVQFAGALGPYVEELRQSFVDAAR